MKEKKADDIYRLSKTHSPLALCVEQTMSDVKPNIEIIKKKFDKYIRMHIYKKLSTIKKSRKEEQSVKLQLEFLNLLITDGFIKFNNNLDEKIVTFENCNAWLKNLNLIEFNLMKIMQLNDNKYKEFIDFQKIDSELRNIFSNETKCIKPFIIEYIKSFIGENVNDSRYFDKDYLIHRKADPAYNLLEVFDGSAASINAFLRGALNYQEGDIFVFCTHTDKQQVNQFEKKTVDKLPEASQIYFKNLKNETMEENDILNEEISNNKFCWQQNFCLYGKKSDLKDTSSETSTNLPNIF